MDGQHGRYRGKSADVRDHLIFSGRESARDFYFQAIYPCEVRIQ
jgi:hypothetical protein